MTVLSLPSARVVATTKETMEETTTITMDSKVLAAPTSKGVVVLMDSRTMASNGEVSREASSEVVNSVEASSVGASEGTGLAVLSK